MSMSNWIEYCHNYHHHRHYYLMYNMEFYMLPTSEQLIIICGYINYLFDFIERFVADPAAVVVVIVVIQHNDWAGFGKSFNSFLFYLKNATETSNGHLVNWTTFGIVEIYFLCFAADAAAATNRQHFWNSFVAIHVMDCLDSVREKHTHLLYTNIKHMRCS